MFVFPGTNFRLGLFLLLLLLHKVRKYVMCVCTYFGLLLQFIVTVYMPCGKQVKEKGEPKYRDEVRTLFCFEFSRENGGGWAEIGN